MPERSPRSNGATIYSVAEAAGVSIATVSRVLQGGAKVSEGTRSKVLKAAGEMSYVPLGAARSLAVQRHEAHGLVLPDLTGPYYGEFIMGYESRAAALGQSVVIMIADHRDEPSSAVRALAARVDGLVFLSTSAVSDTTVQQLGASRPVVLVARDPLAGVDCVSAENMLNATALTHHLLHTHGRRSLLFVGNPDQSPDARERYAGFVAAHHRNGATAPEPGRVQLTEAAGTEFAAELLAGEHRPDGLVCANDELALALMDSLQSGGWCVPEDIAIVGWDDVMTARYVRPGLTTVRQPVRELGVVAAETLHARLSTGTGVSPPRRLSTDIVLRASCGCGLDQRTESLTTRSDHAPAPASA